MKVILVGNGSSILDYELGKYIDSEFDLVFRINRFKIKGFEKYVGSRVDGWFIADTGTQWLNPDDVGKFARETEGVLFQDDMKYIVINTPKFKFNKSFISQINNFTENYKSVYGVDKIKVIRPEIEDEIRSEVKTKFPLNVWPTTGLCAIKSLVNSFQNIYLHGFDGMSKKYKYYHYFDKEDNRTTEHAWTRKPEHNFEIETEYINSLRKDGKLIDINEEMFV